MRLFAALAVLALAGCGGADSTEVTVFAASSLKAPFAQLAQVYEQQQPGTDVVLNLAGSADLVAQLDQGAPAAVLATADEATMRKAQASRDLVAVPFATNSMTIVVPAGNPGQVRELADLEAGDLNVVICAPQVPCGAATVKVEQNAGLRISADSEESAVADVLGKVRSGQADAGIVYASDLVTADRDVEAVGIPESVNATNVYWIAPVTAQGQRFVDLVLSDAGQQVLAEDGFGPP